MVARAKALLGMGVLVGAALAPTTAAASVPVAVASNVLAAAAPAQTESRLTRGHSALNAAIDSQRQGRYEQADVLFREALAHQSELTAEERQDLATRMKANSSALQARREGDEQLKKAESAYKAGRTAEAEELLKKVIANSSVAVENRKKAAQLAAQIRPYGNDAGAPAGNPLPLARAKVQQARAMVNRFDFEGAEQLALEAKKFNASFTSTEDTPEKVMADVRQLKSDPKALLAAARYACERGDYDHAEKYARAVQQKESMFTWHLRGDSPSQVLKDCQAGRARMAQNSAQKPVVAQNQKPADPTPAVRETVGKPPQADTTKPTVTADQTPAKAGSAYAGVSTPAPTPRKDKPEDVPGLMQQAKEQMAAGNLDEASKLANRARVAQPARSGWSTSWDLFEDTPDKLIKQIARLKRQHDEEESWHVLAEGRKLLEHGDLEGASKCAYKAETMHGPYSMMELGDRPHKLLADIQTAQEKKRKADLAAAVGKVPQASQTATNAAAPTPGAPVVGTPVAGTTLTGAPLPGTPLPGGAQTGARPASTGSESASPFAQVHAPGDSAALAQKPLPNGGQTGARSGPSGSDSGSPFAQVHAPSDPPALVQKPLPTGGIVGGVQLTTSGPASDPIKVKAQALLAETRQLQREGRLIEARQKARECQDLKAVYGPDEDRPEQALVQLSSLAGAKIDSLMAEASDHVSSASGSPDRLARAEGTLVQARQLAVSFGLDSFRIDAKLSQVRQSLAQASGTTAPLPIVTTGYQAPPAGQATVTDTSLPPSVPPQGVGSDMLARARLELRSGHSEVARRLAEEALRGNYGVKAEAEAVLRDVNREEYNQTVLAANRTFDAGKQAFDRHDYAQASAIFRTIDVQLLEPAKQTALRELAAMPEMQPRNVMQTAGAGAAPGAGDPGPLPVGQPAPSPEASFATQVQALADVRFQAFREESIQARRQADEMFRAGDITGSLEALQDYLVRLSMQAGGGQMNPEQVAMLRQPVEVHLKRLKTLKAQQDFEHEQTASRESGDHRRASIETEHQARVKQISDLMRRFNELYVAAKYDDAEMVALQAKDLEPDNPIVTAAATLAHNHRNVSLSDAIKREKAEFDLQALDGAERPGPAVTTMEPEKFDPDFQKRTGKRRPTLDILIGTKSRAEQEIERKLSGQITLTFKDKPLGAVLDDIRAMTGVNIVPDSPALNEEMISLEAPMSMTLDTIPAKSALNLILRNAKLTYVIRDDVIQVTTEKNARAKLVQKVYQVTDLVTPIINANFNDQFRLDNKYGKRVSEWNLPNNSQSQQGGSVQPYYPYYGLNTNGQAVGATNSGSAGSMSQGYNPSQSTSDRRNENRDPNATIEDQLTSLIKSTIAPNSWSDSGGPATLEYFPLTHTLVINQTPDIQEQVQDLLSALRRLQDQEVAIEVRFITVAESFYERIGIDFNVNFLTPASQNEKFGPQLTTGQFQPGQLINNFRPDRFITGLTPAGTFTSDLAIPLKSTSFGLGIPPFGAFPNLPGGNGGLDIGVAFLSDIQVFFFMEAAQGDQRTHVMQAPKLTMFNGQTASITVTDTQFFTSDLNVLIIGTQIAFAPVNTIFPTGGVNMFVRAAISGDRRFVRLDMTPTLFNLASAVVPLIPVVTPIFPATFEGGQVQNPVVFTQFIQQPVFNTITVMTSVAVPDGGTVLMGGLKRLSEGRNEFGPPVISKIPYINRLFKNVGYGREVESLMLMVTPRIMIQEEEEERQTGITARQERFGGQ
jgi:type II secretory pathway component GspD/PulD (secretin)/tetratricopeptide (TPR) repeat protein